MASPSRFRDRVALEESTWHGLTIPVDSRGGARDGATRRDEREFDDPGGSGVKRQHDRELGFGCGHQLCMGNTGPRKPGPRWRRSRPPFPSHYEVDESDKTLEPRPREPRGQVARWRAP